jgi:CRISPR-associated protein Csd1
MSQLYQTYENHLTEGDQDKEPLTPIAHMYANAQIEVSIDKDGNFIRAVKLEKGQGVTLIPVSESSSGRSSGVAPHALCDTLSYIAGDFGEYCRDEKQKKSSQGKNRCYMDNLKQWNESDCSHPKVQAIYKYLCANRLIDDLVHNGSIKLDEEGKFQNEKISGQPYEKSLVRFRVIDDNAGGTDTTWKDNTLIDAYVRYYSISQKGRRDICYLQGTETVISENHPKGIVAANYGAKLVSANDAQGYTYRGRFQNADQASALGYEGSQKIHSALTWLVKNQGTYIGNQDKRTFVCWNAAGKKTPDIMDMLDFEDEETVDDSALYKKKLIKTLQGYQKEFLPTDQIMVMGLDAATTGRLSITYYNEFFVNDFFDRIDYWGESCNWFFLKFTEQKKPYYTILTPTFRQIVECAFGSEKGNFIEANDKVLKEQTQRLIKCMLEKQNFPRDIMNALVTRASMPLAYSKGNRERMLSVSCAAIVKFHCDRKKGEKGSMKLDQENHDRSYLFGRLLAVYERVERSTYERGEGREPNAIRLQNAYVNHPMQTRMILEDAVRPYFQKLSSGSREYYRRLISEITVCFQDEDQGKMNQRLKESYLLGYYLQRAEFNKKKEEDISNE